MARAKRQKEKKVDLDFDISFFEGVLRKKPDFTQALAALAEAYTKKGDLEKGLSIDLRLSRLRQSDPVVHYNLACSYSLVGLLDEAFLTLKKAIMLGYEDFDYILKDPDLKNLRQDKRFDVMLKDFSSKR